MGTLSQLLATGFNTATNALTQANGGQVTMRDYQHASRIFRVNNNSFMPKAKNWFHIFFELDPAVISVLNTSLNIAQTNGRINWQPNNLPILGVLAKTVKLPNFKFDVKKNNQYNRWTLTTTKINYDPIEISFWDDTVDTIRGFWYAYYQYMIQDPNYVNFQAGQQQGIAVPFQWMPSTANVDTLYSTSSIWDNNYGLDTVTTPSIGLNRTNPFFRSIRIYQFNHQTTSNGPAYTEYVMVNPVISSFDHDTVDFSSSEFMQNKMTIECETVLYNSGLLEANEVASWDAVLQRFFDNTPSPIATINPNINQLNQVGFVDTSPNAATGLVEDLSFNAGQAGTPTVLSGTVGSAAQIAATTTGSSGSFIAVPTISTNYGTSGAPPTLPIGL
jgi:hypothetical protein